MEVTILIAALIGAIFYSQQDTTTSQQGAHDSVGHFQEVKIIHREKMAIHPTKSNFILQNGTAEPTIKTTYREPKQLCNITEYVVHFDLDSTEIDNTSGVYSYIDYINKCHGQDIKISGYASPDGNHAYNLKLAKKRAASLSNLIKSKYKSIQITIMNPTGHEISERKAVISFSKK